MNQIKLSLLLTSLSLTFFSCKGQKSFGTDQLKLKQNIILPNVTGRIDHIDVNLKDQVLYIAALENNSLEVVDLKNCKTLKSIKELDEPQGVAYIPQTNEIMVANGGSGLCIFFNANSFQKVVSVDLGSDADDVHYDSSTKRIYVGYGNGGIAVLDAISHRKIAGIKLPAHPEGFQLNMHSGKVFVNVPGAREINVIDLKTLSVIDKWETKYNANYPMAIDTAHHVLFIGYRRPGKLVAVNENNGKMISETDLVQDTDDLFFDQRSNELYASGGGGSVNVFEYNSTSFRLVANIPVRNGSRTSLLIPPLNVFVLATKAGGGKPAEVTIFNL